MSTLSRASTARRGCCSSAAWGCSGWKASSPISPSPPPATGISRSRTATPSCAARCSGSETWVCASPRNPDSTCSPADAISLYEPRGDYQLIVDHMEEAGLGALNREFERLKIKLAAEGLFAAARKRALPRFPRRIGVITSPSGAAIRDILHVPAAAISRRRPCCIYPTSVQGAAAVPEILGRAGAGGRARRVRRADRGARRRLDRRPLGVQR